MVRVSKSGWACNGLYRVARATSGEDAQGAYTTLMLTKPELVF